MKLRKKKKKILKTNNDVLEERNGETDETKEYDGTKDYKTDLKVEGDVKVEADDWTKDLDWTKLDDETIPVIKEEAEEKGDRSPSGLARGSSASSPGARMAGVYILFWALISFLSGYF